MNNRYYFPLSFSVAMSKYKQLACDSEKILKTSLLKNHQRRLDQRIPFIMLTAIQFKFREGDLSIVSSEQSPTKSTAK